MIYNTSTLLHSRSLNLKVNQNKNEKELHGSSERPDCRISFVHPNVFLFELISRNLSMVDIEMYGSVVWFFNV